MRILAIDPAARSGWAFGVTTASSQHPVTNLVTGVWLLAARGDDPGGQLRRFDDELTAAIARHRPEVIAYELAGHGSHNMLAKAAHNEKCGVIALVASRHGLPSWGFQPNVWKARAIANGRAQKADVIRRLRMFFGIEARSEDEADAIGVLLAAQQGPPPPTKRQQRSAERKRAKKIPRLF
jgi:Holliday junction resolvasome RuvABC endonuclease subunit